MCDVCYIAVVFSLHLHNYVHHVCCHLPPVHIPCVSLFTAFIYYWCMLGKESIQSWHHGVPTQTCFLHKISVICGSHKCHVYELRFASKVCSLFESFFLTFMQKGFLGWWHQSSTSILKRGFVLVSSKKTIDTCLGLCLFQSLLVMVFPFQWTLPYVPVLSEELLELLEAPGSFLMGCHSRHKEEVLQVGAKCAIIFTLLFILIYHIQNKICQMFVK